MKWLADSFTRLNLLIVVLGSVVFAFPLVRLGGFDTEGNLLGISTTDHFMHLAYSQELRQHFPPQQPLFAGESLYNYHYGSDLLVAGVSRLTRLEPRVVYFKILPWVLAIGFGAVIWRLGLALKMRPVAQTFLLAFAYFGSSFSFVADLVMAKTLSWDDAFGVSQSGTYIHNVPLTLSLILVVGVIILLAEWEKKSTWWRGLILAVLLAVLPMVKVYGGIVAYVAVGAMGLMFLLRGKREVFLRLVRVAVPAGVVGAGLVFYNSHEVGGLVWYPLHPLRRMIESANFLAVTETVVLRIWHYEATGNVLRLGGVFLVAGMVYLVGNVGSRLIGVVVKARELLAGRQLSELTWALLITGSMIAAVPMLTIQQTGGFNITQLFHFGAILLNIPAANGWAILVESRSRRLAKGVVILIFLLLTLPGVVGVLRHEASKTSSLEAEVVEVVGQLSEVVGINEVILLEPKLVGNLTNYVAALSGRRVYLEGLDYPGIQGHPVEEREEKLKEAFDWLYAGGSMDEAERLLGEDKIKVVITAAGSPVLEGRRLEKISGESQLRIYVVD